MGTRSTTQIFNNGALILTLYAQFDGYPEGVGKSIADFILSKSFVNGIPIGAEKRVFNGAGCFAAQLIAHLKDGAGGWYVVKPDANTEEYAYEVHINYDFDRSAFDVRFVCRDPDVEGDIYNGAPAGFAEKLKQLEADDNN